MKNKLLILSLAAFSLAALAVGCNKQENAPIVTSAEVAKPNDPSPADALRAAESQKAADASKAAEELKAADAKKQAEAAAQKEADADKADQALKQVAADKRAAEQTAAERQAQLTSGADKVQSLINSAKALSGENKWADVLKILAQLAGDKLSDSQQTAVNGLKSEAQKQLAAAATKDVTADAGNALGGLLNPKK